METQVNVTANGDRITILHGKAPEPVNQKGVEIKGATVESVLDHILQRKYDKAKAIVTIDEREGTLKVISDDLHPTTSHQVSGEVKEKPELTKLHINTEGDAALIDPKLFERIIKFMPHVFKDRAEHTAILNSLQGFSVRVETDFKNANDFQGNTAHQKIQKAKSDIPLSFFMKCPIYVGAPEMTFQVELEIVIGGNNQIMLSPYSISLRELQEQYKKELFDKVRKQLEGYTIIEL
jgi:AAA+ ATPase superfamily predicted ATPase